MQSEYRKLKELTEEYGEEFQVKVVYSEKAIDHLEMEKKDLEQLGYSFEAGV